MRSVLLRLVTLATLIASPLSSQTPGLPRWGLVGGVGVGQGAARGSCNLCGDWRKSGLSMHARVGGAYRSDLILAAELDGWSNGESSSSLQPSVSVLAMNVVAQWYPRTRGYFVSAGIGGGRVSASRPYPGDNVRSRIGFAFKLGTGYDIRLNNVVAISPFAAYISTSGGTVEGYDETVSAGVASIGVGLSFTEAWLNAGR